MPPLGALALGVLLVLGELAALSYIYKHAIDFTCLASAPGWFCRGASGAMVSIITFLGVAALYVALRPAPFRHLIAEAGTRVWPVGLNLLGFAITLIPLALLSGEVSGAGLSLSFGFWVLGTLFAGIGLALWVAPAPRWVALWREGGGSLIAVTLAGLAAPFLATLIRPLWRSDWVADLTFRSVETVLGLTYRGQITSDPVGKTIAGEGFGINIAPVCSGIEGVALVTLFVTLYLFLFRQELRFPLVLILYPVGILISMGLNVVRIVVLLLIGLSGNPALAVGGFHSHAGWVMFTLVAMLIVLSAQMIPEFRKTNLAPAKTVPPLTQDPVAARILPFVVLVGSTMVTSILSEAPGVLYPLRVLITGAALWAFWPLIKALPWRSVSPLAIGAGVLVGVFWVVIPVEPSDTPPYGSLTGGMFLLWVLFRGFGTMILVPIIEELFFRDYLENRLRFGTGAASVIVAALLSAAAFALLHGRWAEAFLAGLIFSAVCQSTGRITQAIYAHGIANAMVFGCALALGRFEII